MRKNAYTGKTTFEQLNRATRDLGWLVNEFECLSDDNEMVAFIDSLSLEEADILDRAREAGLCDWEPAYILEVA